MLDDTYIVDRREKTPSRTSLDLDFHLDSGVIGRPTFGLFQSWQLAHGAGRFRFEACRIQGRGFGLQ